MPAIRMLWLALSKALFRLCVAARAISHGVIVHTLSNDFLWSIRGYAPAQRRVAARMGHPGNPHLHDNVCIVGVSCRRTISGRCSV